MQKCLLTPPSGHGIPFCLQISIMLVAYWLVIALPYLGFLKTITNVLVTFRTTWWDKRKRTGFAHRERNSGVGSLRDLKSAVSPLRASPPSPMKRGSNNSYVTDRRTIKRNRQCENTFEAVVLNPRLGFRIPFLVSQKNRCLSLTCWVRMFKERSQVTIFLRSFKRDLHVQPGLKTTSGHTRPVQQHCHSHLLATTLYPASLLLSPGLSKPPATDTAQGALNHCQPDISTLSPECSQVPLTAHKWRNRLLSMICSVDLWLQPFSLFLLPLGSGT